MRALKKGKYVLKGKRIPEYAKLSHSKLRLVSIYSKSINSKYIIYSIIIIKYY